MEKHQYKGAMPICMFKDLTGIPCYKGKDHEIHDMRVPDSPVQSGVSIRADSPPVNQEVTDTNHKLKELGDSASIIFRAQNIQEIEKQSEAPPPAEVIEAQNQVLDFAVNTICKEGTWEEQRERISKLINSFRNTMLLLNAKAQTLHVFRAQKDVEYTAGFTDDERAEFERAARKMEKPGKKRPLKAADKDSQTGTKAQFIKDQMKTGLYDLDECEAMWVKIQAKKAAAAVSNNTTDKPKSVTNPANAASSMERHGLSKEQVERIMKGKKQ